MLITTFLCLLALSCLAWTLRILSGMSEGVCEWMV